MCVFHIGFHKSMICEIQYEIHRASNFMTKKNFKSTKIGKQINKFVISVKSIKKFEFC